MPRKPDAPAVASSAARESAAEWAVALVFFAFPVLPLVTRPASVLGEPAPLFAPDVDRRVLLAGLAIAGAALAARRRRLSGAGLAAAAFAAWLGVSSAWSSSPLRALDRATEIAAALAAGAFAWSALLSDSARRRALVFLLAGSAVAGLSGIGQALEGARAAATFGHTNAAAEAQALAVALGAGLLLARPSLPVAACAAVSAAHLVLTRGRGGLVAAVAAVALATALAARGARRSASGASLARPGFAGLLLLAVLLAATGGFATLADRVSSLADPEYPSHRVRMRLHEGTARLVADHPLLGVGAGHFRVAFPPYRSREERRLSGPLSEVETPHDDWAEVLAETGPVGLLLLGALVSIALLGLSRRFRDGPDPGGALAPVVAAFAVLALFRSPLSNPTALLFLAVAAGAAAERADEARGRAATIAASAVLSLASLAGAYPAAAHWIAASALARGAAASLARDPESAAEAGALAARVLAWDDRPANLLAAWLRTAGRRDEAIAALREAISRNPNHVLARIGLAAELRDAGDLGAAAGAIEDARRVAPWEPQLLFALARIEEKRGDPSAALVLDLEAGVLEPDAAPPWASVERLLAGAAGEAIAPRRRSALRDTALGAQALARGDARAATVLFRAAALADVSSPEPHFFLAIGSALDGDLVAASKSLRAAESGLPGSFDPEKEPLLRAVVRYRRSRPDRPGER